MGGGGGGADRVVSAGGAGGRGRAEELQRVQPQCVAPAQHPPRGRKGGARGGLSWCHPSCVPSATSSPAAPVACSPHSRAPSRSPPPWQHSASSSHTFGSVSFSSSSCSRTCSSGGGRRGRRGGASCEWRLAPSERRRREGTPGTRTHGVGTSDACDAGVQQGGAAAVQACSREAAGGCGGGVGWGGAQVKKFNHDYVRYLQRGPEGPCRKRGYILSSSPRGGVARHARRGVCGAGGGAAQGLVQCRDVAVQGVAAQWPGGAGGGGAARGFKSFPRCAPPGWRCPPTRPAPAAAWRSQTWGSQGKGAQGVVDRRSVDRRQWGPEGPKIRAGLVGGEGGEGLKLFVCVCGGVFPGLGGAPLKRTHARMHACSRTCPH